mgnify:CR=1 FL=1
MIVPPPDPSDPPHHDGEICIPDISKSLVGTDETEAVQIWNEMARRCDLPTVQKLTNSRKKKIKARLKDCGGLDGWREAVTKVEEIPGLHGGYGSNGHENWRADFDFLIGEANFIKLMEGKYDHWGRPGVGKKKSGLANAFDDLAQRVRQ